MNQSEQKEKSERIPWDEYWMKIVSDVARRSTCLRRQIGALVVKNDIIISTGYNGAPRGFPHCLDVGCRRDQLNIASGERHEECLPPDVEVITDAGYKSIVQVSTNDRVLTHEGRFMGVVRKISRDYRGELCVLRPKGLLPIRLTPEHPVLAIKTVKCEKDERTLCKETCKSVNKNYCYHPYEDYKAQWIPACEVKKGDLLVLPFDTSIEDMAELDLAPYIRQPPSIYYEVMNTIHEGASYDSIEKLYGISRTSAWNWMHGSTPRAYVLAKDGRLHRGSSEGIDLPVKVKLDRNSLHLFGLYLAEGCSSGNQVTFTFNKAEEDLADEVIDSMRDIFGLAVYKSEKRSEGVSLVFSSKTLAEIFASIFGEGALDKRIPIELMRLQPGKQRYILEGWVEGDGYVDKARDRVTASTISRILALQMLQISLRLGRIPILDYSTPKYRNRKSTNYRLVWHKRSKARYIKDNKLFSPVFETGREFYSGKVYNLEVEGDESYTSPSFVVHNCIGVHAEQNALLQAGRDAEGATLYVNAYPCKICAKLIINARIKRVVMSGEYIDKEGLEYLNKAAIKLTFI